MRLRQVQAFWPQPVIRRNHIGELPEAWLASLELTQDQCFEFWYRMRYYRIDVNLILYTDTGSENYTFSTGALPMHFARENPPEFPSSDVLLNEKELAFADSSPTRRNLVTATLDSFSYKYDETNSAHLVTRFFFGDKIYRVGNLYYPYFYIEVGFHRIGGFYQMVYFLPLDGSASAPVTLSTPWGHIIKGQLFHPERIVTGTIQMIPVEWWEYRDENGNNPIVEKFTGKKLRNHRVE